MVRPVFLLLLCGSTLAAETALVLPFFNHSKSANMDWIGEGIAESVKDTLASEGMLVLERDDRLEAYRRLSLRPGAELTHASILKLGVSVDAANVIYGYFELLPPDGANPGSKGSLRITARIINVKHSQQGSPYSELGALEDLATLEAHLGWQTLRSLRPKDTPDERQFMQARPSVRLDAVESYVRGLLAASAEQRHHFFTQAARLDEHYSQPCFELGKTYWEKKDYKVAAGWLERVSRTDPHYFEARFFLGLSRYLGGDPKGAEECFEQVAAVLPLNEVYNDLGAAQAQRQDFAAAAANFQKALSGDDTDPDFHFNLGVALWRNGKYREAAESFRAALARSSGDSEATVLLGRCLKSDGPRPGEARPEGKPRLKTNYEESAFRQLQAELGKK
ncbi:MAG TPA: tetratricopeptide repeat protein [Candidatus Acidoferrales bacterium]|nr:tetratricopeptide repeat protein [Candidatus Acidoferrales bacterium]